MQLVEAATSGSVHTAKESDSIMSSYAFQKRRREDFRAYLETLGFDFMMTVNYKRKPTSPVQGEREQPLRNDLRHWNKTILEILYGKKFSKRNKDNEFLFVAFVEVGPELDKEHLHLLVRVPSDLHTKFLSHAIPAWKTTRDIDLGPKAPGGVIYCSKWVHRNPDWMIFSNDFRRSAPV